MQIINSILLFVTTNAITEQSNGNGTNNIIGIGGILATIFVGIITCVVTWKLTMRSIKQQQLTYSLKVLNILSNSIKVQENALSNLTITHGTNKLNNPYLLLLEIENTGNEAIINPPICIRSKNDAEIIPGYFQNIPPGYEEKWNMQKETHNSCNILLEHINPKQIVRVCFFIDNSPEIEFVCPMQNVIIQEKGDNYINHQGNISKKFPKIYKVTFVLLALTVFLFASVDWWINFLEDLAWRGILPAPPLYTAVFIFAVLITSLLLNIFGINRLDKVIYKQKYLYRITTFTLLILSIVLTTFLLFDICIIGLIPQVITAVLVIIMLSILIHLISIDKVN